MPHALIQDASFPPARNSPCFCGSGARFKRCCGLRSTQRPPPHGLGVVDGFLSSGECRELVSLADAIEGERCGVLDGARKLPPGPGEGDDGATLADTRVAERVGFGDSDHLLAEAVARAFEEQIIPGTGLDIDWYEKPQLLRYTPGGFYLQHSDAYDYVADQRAWRKVLDRDISLLIYLNDEYEGGELEFGRLSYTLRPRAGMLVFFPSDIRYEHRAKLVTGGCRYVLVSWAAASGVERVRAEPPKWSIPWEARGGEGPAG